MRPNESFVEQPVRSLQTMLRVIAEDDRSYATVIPDGIYGPTTMNAVTVFQRKQCIPVTGIVDMETWNMIVKLYEPALIRVDKAQPIEIIMDPGEVFRYGESSPYIFLLQGMLTQLSIDNISITPPGNSGLIDDATAQSLSEFQKLANLPITGELDKITWKHLVHHFTANAHHNNVIRRRENNL